MRRLNTHTHEGSNFLLFWFGGEGLDFFVFFVPNMFPKLFPWIAPQQCFGQVEL
jgi:hypothetical protein